MKPIVVYDPLTGNGWYEDEVTGDRYFYNQQGIRTRYIPAAAPPPKPPPEVRLSRAPGYSEQQQALADQQAFQRDAETAERARLASHNTPKGGEFDLRGAVRGMLMRSGMPNPGGDE